MLLVGGVIATCPHCGFEGRHTEKVNLGNMMAPALGVLCEKCGNVIPSLANGQTMEQWQNNIQPAEDEEFPPSR